MLLNKAQTPFPVWPTKAPRGSGSACLPTDFIHLILTFYCSTFNFSKISSIYYSRAYTLCPFPDWNILTGTVQEEALSSFVVCMVVWHTAGLTVVAERIHPMVFFLASVSPSTSVLYFRKPAQTWHSKYSKNQTFQLFQTSSSTF